MRTQGSNMALKLSKRQLQVWVGVATVWICLTCLLTQCAADDPDVKPADENPLVASVEDPQDDATNRTSNASTTVSPTTSTTTLPKEKELPEASASEEEHTASMTIFFILLVIAISILVVHLLIQTKFHYLPESVAIVTLGAILGLVLKILSMYNLGNWQTEEHFPPTMFFLILLPPIIFESGYNLHKGNFFQNIGTILVFAILGTVVSAIIVGGGVYLLGQADIAYELTLVESFAFGSLISAVDPVATLAIFQALDVDAVLYMLVFGESVLNDAVSIVLTTSILELATPAMAHMNGATAFISVVGRFCLMFFASSAIGVICGLTSAMLLKFVDLRKTPSLEFGIIIVFSYLPYGLAEGLKLSGIMAILICGIVMSHYTHLNISPITQITVQQTFRTIAFMAETCVFAYLGLAIFSFSHLVQPALVIWGIVLILIGRACNIFPLSLACNYFREHKITKKMQFIMWFSGLRGAIAFALSINLDFANEKRHVLVTSTLIIVLFTLLFLGGSTMPLLKLLKAEKRKKTKHGKEVSLSKTKEMNDMVDVDNVTTEYEGSTDDDLDLELQPLTNGDTQSKIAADADDADGTRKRVKSPGPNFLHFIYVKKYLRGDAVDSEHLSELTEEEYEVNFVKPHLKGFMKLDAKYLVPFFTRRFTQQEVRESRTQVRNLTNQWYSEVRAAPSESEEEEEDEEHEI